MNKFYDRCCERYVAFLAAVLALIFAPSAFAQSFGVPGVGVTLTTPQIVSVADYTSVFEAVGVVGAAVMSMAISIRVIRWLMSLIV